jgi:uncharacterized small protein (DUF1192 family)
VLNTIEPVYWEHKHTFISGVYGLVDDQGRVRYVGSSADIAVRFYGHLHSATRAACGRWLIAAGASGVSCVLLEALCLTGESSTSGLRDDAEERWIAKFRMVGEADLNKRMTGGEGRHHARRFAEVKALRARVAALEEEIARYHLAAVTAL